MPEERYELILEGRTPTLVADNKKLLSDLQTLQRNINKDAPLKLSLAADIPQSVGRIKADLKEIKPQLDNVLKVSVGVDKKATAAESELNRLAGEREKNQRRINAETKKQADLAAKLAQKQGEAAKKAQADAKVLHTQIERSLKSWSAVRSEPQMMADIEKLRAKLNDVGNPQELQRLRTEWRGLGNEIGIAGKQQKSFGDKVSETGGRLLAYFTSLVTYTLILGRIRDSIQAVKEIDSSLVELQKVSDLTGASLARFADRAFVAGNAIGRTGKDVLDAVTTFKRAGYELEASFDMAKAALVMTNVGDGIRDVEEASSALIATLRGFKIGESEAMAIVDAINEVSNTAPIGFQNLTEGLRRVSGTLYQAGTDLNQTMGLLTGGFSSLRDIEGVSSGLLMISQRLRGISEDGEEISGLLPKLQKDFKEIANIDISKGNGELRSTYEILSDMAAIFPMLTEEQRQYLGELAAGNMRVKVLNAILQNWTDVEKAVKSAANSTNSAAAENEKYLNSIEGKTQRLASSFQKTAVSIVDSGVVKFFIDAATAAVEFTGAGNGALAKVVALTGAVAGLNAASKTATWKQFTSSITDVSKTITGIIPNAKKYGDALLLIKNLNKSGTLTVDTLAAAMSGLNQAQMAHIAVKNKAVLLSVAKNKADLVESLQLVGLTSEKAAETAAEILNTQAKGANAAATAGQTAANVGFLASIRATTAGLLAQAAAWLATPMGIATVSIAAIFGIVKAVDALTVTLAEQKEKLRQVREEYDSLARSLSQAEDELKQTKDRIAELLQLQESGKITFVEEDELNKLKESNIELEKQTELLRLQKENKNKEIISDVVKTFNKDINSAELGYVYESGKIVAYNFRHGIEDGLATLLMAVGLPTTPRWVDKLDNKTRNGAYGSLATEKAYIEQEIKRYQELGAKMKDVRLGILDLETKRESKGISDAENTELKRLKAEAGEYDKIHTYLLKKQEEFQEIIGDLKLIENPTTEDEKAFNKVVGYYQTLNDIILSVASPEQFRNFKFSELINSKEFEDVVNEIKELCF